MANDPNLSAGAQHHQAICAYLQEAASQPTAQTPNELMHFLRLGKAQLQAQFEQHLHPFTYMRQHSNLIDALIRGLFLQAHAIHQLPLKPYHMSVVATGGYGRQELYPYSDLDLLFLGDPTNEALIKVRESILHQLWDLGFTLGYATRSIDESVQLASQDHSVCSALADARLICGASAPFQRLSLRLQQSLSASAKAQFLRAKMLERKQRYTKHGGNRFLLEPNIKENQGGLRDVHLIGWLSKLVCGHRHWRELTHEGLLSASELRSLRRAHRFLATLRILLHLQAGRAEERLSFDAQLSIARTLGYRNDSPNRPVERFMKRYFQTTKIVAQLCHLIPALLEEQINEQRWFRPYQWIQRQIFADTGHEAIIYTGSYLHFSQTTFDQTFDPTLCLAMFDIAQRYELEIHPRALQYIAQQASRLEPQQRDDGKVISHFRQLLFGAQAANSLRLLNDTRMLGWLVPEFRYVIGQMQFDGYHIYTVDEHIIRLIEVLNQIEQGVLSEPLPLASEVIRHINAREALILAGFCHDIAKGRGGDHARKGAVIARQIAQWLQLDAHTSALASWLVEHHLIFSHTAFSRDLSDPQTLLDFVEIVQSPERLRLLLLLTVADIQAVGPNLWNRWKGTLLRECYHKALMAMGTPEPQSAPLLLHISRQHVMEKLDTLPEQVKHDYVAYLGEPALLGIPEEYHPQLAGLVLGWQEHQDEIHCHQTIHHFEGITHLWVHLPDITNPISLVSGTLALMGANIVACRSFRMQDRSILMLLELQDSLQQAFEDTQELQALPKKLEAFIHAPADLYQAVKQRRSTLPPLKRALYKPPQLFLDHKGSHAATIMEISCLDRPFLLHDITTALNSLDISISTANIATYGEQAVDVFYIKDKYGMKITHPARQQQIRREVLAMLVYDGA